MFKRTTVTVGLAMALALAAASNAQRHSAMQQSAAAAAGIQYFSGGVGLDQRDQMRGLAVSHNLLIKFAEADGDYVIPESVAIRKGNAEMLRVSDAGPLLYLNLPNGTYTLAATYNGMVRTKVVQVAGRSPDLVLTWPTPAN